MHPRIFLAALTTVAALLAGSCGAAEAEPAQATTTIDVEGRFNLSGSVVLRDQENLTLPPGARVLIRLADASIQDAASVLIAEATSTILTLPLRYELLWDADLDPGRDYRVSATVLSATGELLYASDAAHPFWPGDADVTVELVAA